MSVTAHVPLDEEQIQLLLRLLEPGGGWSEDPLRGRTQAALSAGLVVIERRKAPPPREGCCPDCGVPPLHFHRGSCPRIRGLAFDR